jgi:CheY-like chemotaxis protein
LAVVHGIIKSYSGHIMVQSTPGQGTTFIVLLPCYQGEEQLVAPPLDSTVLKGHGERLLVIDDEKYILLFWKLLLEDMGYQVTAIEDARVAYEWLIEHVDEIDGILTDLSMPYMTGLELSHKIKKFAPSMPIALSSGFSSIELQKKAQALYIKAFIKKPVDNVQLSQALRSLFS